MKRFKKILAMVIAMAMVLGMSAMTAFADNTESTLTTDTAKNDGEFKIELSSAEDGHTFKAYRIFDGSVATIDGDITLGDISWATGVTTSGIDAELKTAGLDDTLGGTLSAPNLLDFTKAPDVARAMALQQDDSAVMIKVADVFYAHKGSAIATATAATDGKYTLSPLVAGYYLVTDEYTNASNVPAGAETLSRNIMAVVADVAAEVKNDKPTVEKKILTDGASTKADANTANVGETVVYEIEGKVPNYTGYDKYFYVINDTLSDGLTFNGASNVVVTIEDAATQPVAGTDYIVYVKGDATNPADSPYTFQVAFKNIKAYEIGKKITVKYSATVNENAEVGSTGNPNTTNVIYSNNPNDSSDGNPSTTPKPTDDIPTGISADDKTVTYVAELDLTKYIDSISGANLAGAEFTLTGTSTVVEGTTANKFVADDNGTYYRLTDGTYTTSVPHGEILNSDGSVAVTSNESSYSSTTTKYSLQGETTYGTDTKDVFMQATTGANGKISFKGLGAGTYTIKETVTPKGYTTADPITVTFTVTVPTTISTGEETATWVSNNADVVVNGSTGIYETNVIDLSGSVLPSTGGIGTTIFYVVGAILVIGAGVVLITRRRMDA
ncbi:MAG: isopeptide-forming domain-containing fimbrial protein [Parasporobacterium sp.]|nr:isopeptide-forming domain-containing fimbrial protein [Parasporobacterium sp.]